MSGKPLPPAPTEAELRRAFASGPGGAPGPDCPPLEQLWRCASGAAPGPEVAAVAEHFAGCSSCAEAWRLAAALREPEQRSGGAPVLPLRRFRPAPWLAGLAAAAAAAGVALVLHRPAPETAVLRGEASPSLQALVTEAPASDCELRWTALPGATYDVTVTAADGAPLFQAERLATAAVRVPPSALRGVPAGGQVRWRVRARLDDGRTATSATVALTLR